MSKEVKSTKITVPVKKSSAKATTKPAQKTPVKKTVKPAQKSQVKPAKKTAVKVTTKKAPAAAKTVKQPTATKSPEGVKFSALPNGSLFKRDGTVCAKTQDGRVLELAPTVKVNRAGRLTMNAAQLLWTKVIAVRAGELVTPVSGSAL